MGVKRGHGNSTAAAESEGGYWAVDGRAACCCLHEYAKRIEQQVEIDVSVRSINAACLSLLSHWSKSVPTWQNLLVP